MAEAFLTFYLGTNTQSLQLLGLTAYDPVTDTSDWLDATANVFATVYTKADNLPVAGLTNITFIHRSGSDGDFFHVLDGSELTTEGIAYEVEAHGDDGAGSTFQWRKPLKVRVRRDGAAA